MKRFFALFVLLALCAFPSTVTPAFAQTRAASAHRSIDFTQTLEGVDGKPLLSGDANSAKLTLGDIASGALSAQLPDDAREEGSTKFKRGELAHRIYKAKSIELTVEEISLIKDRIGKAYGPVVVYAAWPLLDPATK